MNTSPQNLFRLTCQRLGQLQEKNDSQANITRGDISTLLHQHNVSLARAKAQKLLQDDAFGDVLEILGMHTGILTEHVHELDPTSVTALPPHKVQDLTYFLAPRRVPS